jgi:hypothetical protein
MATKAKKVTRKKSLPKVRDLAVRKNPKGGAQKKEGHTMPLTGRTGSRVA